MTEDLSRCDEPMARHSIWWSLTTDLAGIGSNTYGTRGDALAVVLEAVIDTPDLAALRVYRAIPDGHVCFEWSRETLAARVAQ